VSGILDAANAGGAAGPHRQSRPHRPSGAVWLSVPSRSGFTFASRVMETLFDGHFGYRWYGGRSRASPQSFNQAWGTRPLAPVNATATSKSVARIPPASPFDATRSLGDDERTLLDERRGRPLTQTVYAGEDSGMGGERREKECPARGGQQRCFNFKSHFVPPFIGELIFGQPFSFETHYVTSTTGSQGPIYRQQVVAANDERHHQPARAAPAAVRRKMRSEPLSETRNGYHEGESQL
jgi:hypothetical protein